MAILGERLDRVDAAAFDASVKQDRRGVSSTSTVQAPHSPPSQPVFVPVTPTTSRK
jgi:hypothetical protein